MMNRARLLRWSAWTGVTIVALVLLAILIVAAMPFGWLKPTIERHLSDRFGSAVTIGAIKREDAFSFVPRVFITDVRVPQPGWAGHGDLATIRDVQLSIPVWPMLLGRIRPRAITIDGLSLALVRGADGRENWRRDKAGSTGGAPDFTDLAIRDGRIGYRDAKLNRRFDVTLAASPGTGLRLSGNGVLRGSPVRVAVLGAPLDHATDWPFRATIAGPDIHLMAKGKMNRPLDTDRMTLDLQVRADDLKMLDAVIEAGLFGTQPIALSAHAVHNDPDWTITGITGTIGRSDIAGNVKVSNRNGRHVLDGDVTANRLDFDDLASNAGKARTAAVTREIGERVIPDTRIDLSKLAHTDGIIRITAHHLIGSGSPPLASLTGTLTLDHSRLTAPLRFGLTSGTASGMVTVDQRDRTVPMVTIDLTLSGATLAALSGGGTVDGPVRGRLKLTGPGHTIREAVAHSDGHVGLFANGGTLPAKLASLIGFDIGRGITADSDSESSLRCIALGLDVRDGLGRVDPLVVDTPRGRADGSGTISLATEQLAIELHGAPKKNSLLRFPGTARLDGTIRAPGVELSEHAGSLGTIFKALGRTIAGKQGKLAQDADCAALSRKTLSTG